MGAAPSTPRPEDTAESLIGVFVGYKSCMIESDYWEKLLEVPLTLHWPSHRVKHACQLLVQNNKHTKHLAKILVHLGWCLQECISGSRVLSSAITKALNALYISSVFLKYLIEYSKSDNFEELHLSLDEEDMPNNLPKDQDIQHFLIHNVLNFIGKVDVSPNTYVLHYELLNFMLITMSTQLRSGPSPGPSDFHPFADAAMAQDSSVVGSVVCKLLLNYITRPHFSVNSNTILSEDSQPGVLQKVGSAAANFVWLPFNLFTGASDESSRSPLADMSLNILLVLVHYRKCVIADYVKDKSGYSIDSLPKEETFFSENPFCKALENAQDIELDRADIEGNVHDDSVVKVPFASLFDTLGMYLSQETSVLLLYSLVHGNSNFLEYVLVRTDLDTLLVTLLETLYNASKRSSNHIYMVLIILLILSQDSSFNASIHKLMLPGVTWYKERRLHQTSLGSLMLIVLIRTVKYNLSKLQDMYLHTNCLATLANMAPHVHYLSGYASQRLISLFYMLSRKYNKLAEMKNGKMLEANGESTEGDFIADDASTELHIYTDFLRIVLEIVNAILTYALPRNPEVVYAIMHRQEVFQPFKNHPRFNELLENIFTVLDFFNVRMDAQETDGEWSVEKVLELIVTNCRSWRGEGIKMFTPLHFTYEQESHPEEFFIPYVWKLVMSSSGLSFNMGSINLFAVDLPVDLSTMDSFGDEMDKFRNELNEEFGIEVETPV